MQFTKIVGWAALLLLFPLFTTAQTGTSNPEDTGTNPIPSVCAQMNWSGAGDTINPSCIIGTMNAADFRLYAGGNQWMNITSNGKVGIRTLNPVANFQVGNTWPLTWTRYADQGNGIERRLIGLNAMISGAANISSITPGKAAGIEFDAANGILTLGVAQAGAKNWDGNFHLYENGNALLDGLLCAREIRVRLNSNPCWPDYVFEESYPLMPLEEVSDFVRTEGHLPGIPDAATVEAEGFEVGEMNRKLLEKVEELTLYLIGLKAENDELKARMERLETGE